MRWLPLLVLALAITAQGQTLCFSAPASCPQNTSIFFSTEAAPHFPAPRAVMPVLRPVVPLELSSETEPFFLTGRASLMTPSSYSGGVPLAPVPVYGGSTSNGTYGSGAGAIYGGNTASGAELPPMGSGSAPGGGVTVNTGFGPH